MVLVSALLALGVPALAFALPSSSFLASRGLIKRQASVPQACAFVCEDIQTALSSCANTTCLCNTNVLDSFLTCSECTLDNTSPTNVNVSIASYQASIDAYRTSCSSAENPVYLPNVTVTVPPANATYSTGLPSNSSSSSSLPLSSSSAGISSSSSSALLSSSAAISSSASVSSSPSASSAGASASASSTTPSSAASERWASSNVVLWGLTAAGLAVGSIL